MGLPLRRALCSFQSRLAFPAPRLSRAFGRASFTSNSAGMEKIEFGDGLPGYEIGDKSAPALVVIQEWWGITQIIKDHAALYNQAGFRCLVPDLYKGKIGVDAEEAHHLMSNLDFPAAVEELKAAVKYLRDTGSPKVGVVGFCMGGALTFCAAQHANVDAAAPFYGTPNAAICQVEKIQVPVQAHFGELDAFKGFADAETAKSVVDKMKAAGVDVDLFMYPDAGHAFMNLLTEEGPPKMKEMNFPLPAKDTAETALQRSVDFFKKHLAP